MAIWSEAIARVTDPLPGQGPYCGQRPIHVPLRFAGLSVADFLKQRFAHVPASQWEEALAAGEIRWEGQRAVLPSDRVRGGTTLVHIKPMQREPRVACDIRPLFADDSILVLAKPAPLPMHPCGRFCRNTLTHMLSLAFAKLSIHIVHRLDADTSGVIVLARHRDAARNLVRQFEERRVQKSYRLGVWGAPSSPDFVQHGDIDPDSSDAGSRKMVDQGRECSTRFVCLEQRGPRHALLQAYPQGGRTHQIRIHAAASGYPIVGDRAYGIKPQLEVGFSRAPGQDRPFGPALMLHAQRLAFAHPDHQRWVEFEAPLPAWARDANERRAFRSRANSE